MQGESDVHLFAVFKFKKGLLENLMKMESVYLCSFADSRMPQTLKRVKKQAEESGFFKDIYLYDEHSLGADFQEKFSSILKGYIRGFGYWVWKPYVVMETLKKIPDGEILLYMDAGCHIKPEGKNLFDSWVKRVSASESGLLVWELPNTCIESYYTKGDLLDFLGVRNQDKIVLTPQRAATFFFIRKEEKTLRLIKNWLSVFETDFHLIDDTESASPNMDGFIENRHDQSVFSILTKINGGG